MPGPGQLSSEKALSQVLSWAEGYQIAFADLDIHPPITKTHERISACRTQTRYYFP